MHLSIEDWQLQIDSHAIFAWTNTILNRKGFTTKILDSKDFFFVKKIFFSRKKNRRFFGEKKLKKKERCLLSVYFDVQLLHLSSISFFDACISMSSWIFVFWSEKNFILKSGHIARLNDKLSLSSIPSHRRYTRFKSSSSSSFFFPLVSVIFI